ncbi:MAG: hypothetical protein GY832_17320 [Chloroflexi bacterium]|nr:hypothetical protein [Chloroflexota bacterium]
MNKRWRWLFVTLMLPVLLTSLGVSSQTREKIIACERYDVEIAIQPDGSLLVAEMDQMCFGGEFHTGFAGILLDRITEVTDVQVWEAEAMVAKAVAKIAVVTDPAAKVVAARVQVGATGAAVPYVPKVVEGGEDLDRVRVCNARKVDLCLSSIYSVLVLGFLFIIF